MQPKQPKPVRSNRERYLNCDLTEVSKEVTVSFLPICAECGAPMETCVGSENHGELVTVEVTPCECWKEDLISLDSIPLTAIKIATACLEIMTPGTEEALKNGELRVSEEIDIRQLPFNERLKVLQHIKGWLTKMEDFR